MTYDISEDDYLEHRSNEGMRLRVTAETADNYDIDESDYLDGLGIVPEDAAAVEHFGILRRSGRYPWGSGGDVETRSRDFLSTIESLRKQGMTPVEIARGFSSKEHPFTTTDLRAATSIANNAKKQADISMAQRLKDKGMSNVAIGERMGIRESSVRALLAPGQKDKVDVLQATTGMLRDQVKQKQFVDIGAGVASQLGISNEKLAIAVAALKEEGYEIHSVQVDQLGTNKKTTVKVLAPPGTKYLDVKNNKDKIQQIRDYSEDGGRTFDTFQTPLSIDSKRLAVRYAEEGGADADGVIYVRPGIEDISLGGTNYAQVRVAIDNSHYLKGMAMYKDDLPEGVDLMFNTNKSDTGNKLDALKPIKKDKETGENDPDLPFGSVVRQIKKTNPDGSKTVTSAMNIVNDEGDWERWSSSLASQMLSKQSPELARQQLNMTYENRKNELDAISKLTNPVVKQTLLKAYADSTDAAAVHLKAAALPKQKTHVILPINSLKDNEIYATNYNNGDRVVLIRFPHGGKFEIPELTVNNRNAEGRKLLGRNPKNAVGINSKVAARLSGADFDGDTVLVIPNNNRQVKTEKPLAGLQGFDPQRSYPAYEGMPKMSAKTKQQQMGLVSNLITDMTIQGASNDELARAVRHSMVVIDAEKHNLNYKQSAINNGIPQLMEKYQGKKTGGASTLISNSGKSTDRVPERELRKASEGGPIDPATGKLVYVPTGKSYTRTSVNKRTGETKTKEITKLQEVSRLGNAEDAHSLSSGTVIEKIYADHSNRLKDLANQARKEMVNTKPNPVSDSAKKVYASEVATLGSKLRVALENAPLERQAQLLANAQVSLKRQANPDMENSELKKIKGQALAQARIRTGAHKERIYITDQEWDAIQAGAISTHQLNQILTNADLDRVRELATPRSDILMTPTKKARAQAMLASGYTQAEVAAHLGVSLTTLKNSISE